jgi:hypothetical protein
VRPVHLRVTAPVVAAVGIGLLTLPSPAQQPAPDTLQACAAIEESNTRLACYDALAKKAAPPASVAAATRASAAAARGAATSPVPVVPVRSAATSAAAAPETVAATPESFGLYRAEHPVATPGPASLTARVSGLGVGADGHPTVRLEGGALWELLDGGDALLSSGDQVTIRRASFQSFIMSTPSRREHRVRRLQ